MTRSGTFSEKAWATPGKAFSMPGPAWASVREADADALLPAQNRTDVERGAGLDQRVAGIAGEELRSLAPEDFGDDGGAIHGLVPPLWITGLVR